MEDNRAQTDNTDLGFGAKNYARSVRFINRDGSVNVTRSGLPALEHLDVYHWLISASRLKLSIVIALWYLGINLFFAAVYSWVGAGHFGGLDHGSAAREFADLFFFSAQTITTLGYGHIYPIGYGASTAAAIESLLGLLSFAVATGILFGRVSRPRAHIIYSRNLLLSPYRDNTGMMFRITNKKQYELIESEASITLSIMNPGTNKREFHNLPLEISRINFLAFSWTVVHPIDKNSPVYGLSARDLEARDAEVLILFKAISDTFSQTVYSRYSYKAADIIENAKFSPMKQASDEKGKLNFRVTEIHNYEKT